MKIYKMLIVSFVASALLLMVTLGGVMVHQFFIDTLGSIFTVSQKEIGMWVKMMAAFFGITAFSGFFIVFLSLLDPLRKPGYITSIF